MNKSPLRKVSHKAHLMDNHYIKQGESGFKVPNGCAENMGSMGLRCILILVKLSLLAFHGHSTFAIPFHRVQS